MRRTATATLAGLLLTAPCFIGPAAAQAPNVQQLLQGLLSGNQSQDQALQDAFERGYQRGREDEARRAVSNGCELVGINNRDLSTFEVDLGTTERLRKLLPSDVVVVAESGVSTSADARRLREAGADALLVGESLMKSGDAVRAIEELLN